MLESMVRGVFRREQIPAPVLWVMAADGMATWYRWLARGLTEPLGGREAARRVLAEATAPAFERRYAALRAQHATLPDDPRAVALTINALHRAPGWRRAAFVLDGVGGGPKTLAERARGWRLIAPLSYRQRWEEVTVHLGEVLIALTERLPKLGLARTNAVLGQICYDAGVLAGEQAKRRFGLPDTPDSAIEVLRMSEYLFRVNPEHTATSDAAARTGSIEGNACPWYARPGWGGQHCGIFGQFQRGVSAVFGLRYQLVETIPRHGGSTCKIDLTPIDEPRRRAKAN
ncbi:MAG: hypothetical protein KC620_07465 [Myxococcales bacterium]|nr:hypothetical protein [Myxococcales bacterium]